MSDKSKISDFMSMIRYNIIVIFIFMILGSAFFGLYAKHKRTTMYTASTNLVIGHDLDKTSYRNSTALSDINMMHTYKEQISDPMVANKARKLLPKSMKKQYSEKDISNAVSVKIEDNSTVMTLHAKTKSAKESVKIANSTANAFKDEFENMNPSTADVKLLAPAKLSNVTSETKPSLKKYGVLGAALGILVGMLIAFGVTSYRRMTK